MNCKPGDLAILTGASSNAGKNNIGMIVEVLHLAPTYRFQLPNGKWHTPGGGASGSSSPGAGN